MKKLKEKLNDLVNEAQAIVDKAKTETRALTEEELANVRDLQAQADGLKATIAAEEALKSMQIEAAKRAAEEKKEAERAVEVTDEERETAAFESYIRGYAVQLRDETPSDVNLTKDDNGAVIPTSIANRIIKRIYDICPILEKSERYTIKGNLDLPYYDTTTDTVTMAYQSEFTPLTSHSGKFLSIQLGGFLAGALTKISKSLINNSQFNVVDFIINEMADSAARFVEGELIKGTVGKVTGLSTLTNGITADGKTAVKADELIDLKDSVKDAYQKDAIWVMSPATRTAIRKLKDDVGRYLLNEDFTSPFGYVLLGKPVYVTDNMPDMAASAKAIYYGDFSGLATKFSEKMNIDVMREKFLDEHAVGVVGWLEFDGKVRNQQKLAVLTMHAN